MTTRLARWAATGVLLGVWLPAPARADRIERGYVVRIEAGEIYFDIGAKTGLVAGAPVRFKRSITLKHPVSGKDITDELPLGELAVTSVGEILSVAVPGRSGLAEPVQAGDVAEAYVVKEEAKPKPAPAPPKPKPDAPPLPPADPLPRVDPETERMLLVWAQTGGKPVAERIRVLEAYLAENPRSPFAAAVGDDIQRLKDFHQKLEAYRGEATASEPVVAGLAHDPRGKATHHEPLALAFAADDPAGIRAAWIHFRKRGSETFRKAELRRDGDAYLRGDIPGDVVEAPGIEYFVEVATRSGEVGSAAGTPSEPIAVAVDAERQSRLFTERKQRSRVSLRATYLDYATLDPRTTDQTDRFFLFEADFLYRLHTLLYGVRVGFGVLNGTGGTIDAPMGGPEKSGFNYGYWELELRGRWGLAFLGRLVAGLGDDGLGFGVEGRTRIGQETGSNLTFAVSTLANIGFLSELHLQWAVFPRFPLGFGVALTNQPLGEDGDLGVRFSADVGVRTLRWFQPTLRVSYQGRTVEHSGFGAGLGLVFDW